MMLVAAIAGGLALAIGRVPTSESPSKEPDAVLVDLPPLEAGSHDQGDEAPTQEAASASSGAPATPTPPTHPTPERDPYSTSIAKDTQPPPSAQRDAAMLEQRPPDRPHTVAPASPHLDAHQAGDAAASRTTGQAEDADTHHASTHLITLWQQALMARLQRARHGLQLVRRPSGIVRVAFAIDLRGSLVSESVTGTSGSPALDAAALALVRLAAPFPRPPQGAGPAELSFVVPISFRHSPPHPH